MGEPPLRGAVLWRPSENQIIMLKIIFPIIISETKTPREIRGAFFVWSVRPIEIFAEIHDFQGFAGLHPLFFGVFAAMAVDFPPEGQF